MLKQGRERVVGGGASRNGAFMPLGSEDGQIHTYQSLARVHEQLAQAHKDLRHAYSQLEQSNLELAEKARRLQALFEVAKSVTSDLDLQKTFDSTIDVTCHLLKGDCCSIRILDAKRQELVMRASRGLSRKYLDKGSVKVGESVAGTVVREGVSRTVADMQHNSSYRHPEYAAAEGLRSLFCVPLRAKGKVIAVLTVYWKRLHELQDEEITLMEAVAELAGVALATANAHDQLESTHKQLSSIHSLTREFSASLTLDYVLDVVIEAVAEQLCVERAAVLLLGRPTELVVKAALGPSDNLKPGATVRLGEGIAGWVAREGRSVLINDASDTREELHKGQGWKRVRSILAVPLKARGEVIGVVAAGNKLDRDGFTEADKEFLEALAGNAAMSVHAASLYSQLQRNYVDIVTSLATAIETRDRYTKGHSERVSWLAAETAASMGLNAKIVGSMRQVGRLHDIGKIGWTDVILNKKGPLTEDEWGQVRKHPLVGSDIVSAAEIISGFAPLVAAHHERIDGSGYPQHLRGDTIPLGARIVAVADSYDAMRSERPYRQAPKSERETRAELIRNARKLYEPEVVEAFLRTLRRAPVEEWESRFRR